MDFLEFFTIVEADRDILNPISAQKLEKVAQACVLRDGLRVLDIGSGKGAMLRQWAQTWHIHGTGLELNPAFVQAARELAVSQRVDHALTFWQGNALDFQPDPTGYDVVTCLGAPFAIGSFLDAAQWMHQHVTPQGVLVLGDVYLKTPAPAEAQGEWWATLPSLAARCAEFESVGVELTGLVVSATDDWDHYSSLLWNAADQWARSNPDHPGRAELRQKVEQGRTSYLRWEREHLGWAVLVGRARP